ncbi:MAG TPA: winged helix DNA-binding domain-containing protein [Saprospiraceae bacterium]|nr:winged helix DNA-binding domain-containing protein [Saprospiraceae bacterium]HPI08316.1 winged helix DNA-binding domain-containing protein [Saprospiraceae bacterium]
MNHELAHVARYRLQNQQIIHASIKTIGGMAAWMGATQAQDYTHAKWAFGLRIPGITDADVEAAIDRAEIIRTHMLRPTWHFVAAEDLRWMLALTAPQIHTIISPTNRLLGLDESAFEQSKKVIVQSLQGGRQLTREELMVELNQAGIATNDLRSSHIMIRAEVDGVVCNGSRRGKQFTYALIDERVPKGKMLDRPDAIAELARRYFRSHGPATLHDFQWWSGLKMSEARAGLEAAQPDLISETIGKWTYWLPNDFREQKTTAPIVHLLPAFDEFLVSYKDRAASLDPSRKVQTITGNGIFKPVVVQNAWVHGIWQRAFTKKGVDITHTFFEESAEVDPELLREATERVERFYF